MTKAEERALEAYPEQDMFRSANHIQAQQRKIKRRVYREGYRQAEKDLGWHPSTEHPPVDEEVIVLLGRYEDFPQIAFGHIVDQNIAIDYNGWNIPGVKYWMPMPKLPKEEV